MERRKAMQHKDHIWTAETVKKLIRLWANKTLTGQDIANELKVSRSAVLGKVRRLKLPYREKRTPRTTVEAEVHSRKRHPKKAVLKEPLPTEAEQQVVLDPTKYKTILDLHYTKECHYPVESTKLFCGQETTGKSVYCAGHEKLCKGPALRKPMTEEGQQGSAIFWRMFSIKR